MIKDYTIDTEDQLIPKEPSIPALIQIEYVYENHLSILLLIECMHLPKSNEPTFMKIKQLCKLIFSNGHTIYSWGNIEEELEDFYRYNLFDENDIKHVNGRNIQNEFKKYFNKTYPTSPDIKLEPNDKYSLQYAIFNTFNEWLTKRFTLGDFGCGLDLALNTITVPRQFMYIQEQVIEAEEEIRQLLVKYALNDCLSVTKLVNELPLPLTTRSSTSTSTSITTADNKFTLNYYEEELDDISSSDEIDYHVEIHAPNDKLTLNDDDIPDEPAQNSLTGVHVQNEPYEMISDDDIDDISLPEIMKIHLPFEQHHLNEPSNDIRIISNDDIEQHTTTRPFQHRQHQQYQQCQPLTRNQKKNRKKRAKRYTYEIIRKVYREFTTTDIKKILIFMNIRVENVNVVGHTLFLDMKNEQIKKEVDGMLHDGLFTEEHYYRIKKKFHLGRK
jgi:hypothetical protein